MHTTDNILERITDAFVALDKDWCYTYMNKKAGEIFNRVPAEMIGKHIWTEFPEGIDQPFYKAYHRALDQQQYIYVEEYYPPYDKWFENHIYPSPDGLSIFFRDITEKKRTEEGLSENRAFIESIINASPDFIYIYDIDERKNIYINEGIQLNLGYTDEEIKQMGDRVLPMLMHPEDFEFYINTTYPKYATAKDKEIITHECRMKDKSGNWHWLYSKESIFLRNPDGKPKQIFGVSTDITEKKTGETALKESNFSHSETQRIAKVGNWTYYMTGELKWSEEIYQLYGLASKITLPTPDFFFELIHPDDREKMQQWMQISLAGGNPGQYEFRAILSDGSMHYYSGSGEMKYDADNRPIYLRGTVQDITERKKAEEDLQEAHQRLSHHLQNTPLAIIEWDKNLIIQEWSPQAENIFGWSEAEVINKHFNEFNLVFQEDAQAVGTIGAELMTGAVNQNKIINRNNTKSGNVIYCQWFNSVLKDEKGNVNSILSLIQDITESKKADFLLSGEKRVLEMIATEQPLQEILDSVALNFESFSDNALCSILLLDDEGTHVRHGAGPSLPDAYNKGIDGEPIGPVAGSCGTAAYRKERVIVADIATDPLWVNYRDFALSFGLKASWSTPIINTEGKVYGTFAIYYRECRSPAETDLSLIDRSANHVKIVLERFNKNKLIKESEENYRSLIDQATDGIIQMNDQGEIMLVNTALSRMLGYTTEEILKLNIKDTYLKTEKPLAEQRLDQVKEKGSLSFERIMIKKDGTTLPVEVSIGKVGAGKILGIVRDITERKKNQEALAESENYLRTILETEPECVKILGLKGELLSMNPAGLAMIEADHEEQVLGHQMTELVNIKYRGAFNRLTKEVFKGNSGTLEFEITGLKGGQRWLETHAVPLKDAKSKIISLLGITRDITERKKAEEATSQLNQDLEIRVKERTAELEKINTELEEINDLFVGREARIIELKEELEELRNKPRL